MDDGPMIAEHPFELEEGITDKELSKLHQFAEKIALPYVLDKFLRKQREYNERIRKLSKTG